MDKNLSFAVFAVPNFRPLLSTRMFVTMALQSQAVIVGWQVYSITKDPFLLGLTGLTEAIPAIIGALFSGHIVDITPPLKVYKYTLGALFLNTLALFLFAGHILPVPGGNLLPWIFVGVFISGLVRSFMSPSSFSIVSQIVPRSKMPAAGAWMSSAFQMAAVGGPALAGLIYGGYDARGAWLLPVILMSVAVVLVQRMKIQHVPHGEKREPIFQSMKSGWRFILRTPVLLSVMALDMFAVLFGGAVAMLPAYADQVLHVGSEGLGALRAAPALGAIITALILALWPMKRITAVQLLLAVTGFGLCMIGFGLSTVFWLSLLFLAASGAFDSVSMLIRATLVQLLTPNHMRGRVSAINSMFIISSNEIGAFESGTAARLLGLVPSVVMGGIATLVIVVTTAVVSPKFRKTVIRTDEE